MTSKAMSINLLDLPRDSLCDIISFLNPWYLLPLSRVCRDLRDLLRARRREFARSPDSIFDSELQYKFQEDFAERGDFEQLFRKSPDYRSANSLKLYLKYNEKLSFSDFCVFLSKGNAAAIAHYKFSEVIATEEAHVLLFCAVLSDKIAIVKELMARGIDARVYADSPPKIVKRCAGAAAIVGKNPQMLQFLISAKFVFHEKILDFAAKVGDCECIKILLNAKYSSTSSLEHAVAGGNVAAAELLVASMRDTLPNPISMHNLTPMAIVSENLECVKYVAEHGVFHPTDLFGAVFLGNYEIAAYLIKELGVQVANSALKIAAANNDVAIVKLIYENTTRPRLDPDGAYPLQIQDYLAHYYARARAQSE